METGEILVELWVYGGACWCIKIIGWVEDIKINFDNQVMVELYCK